MKFIEIEYEGEKYLIIKDAQIDNDPFDVYYVGTALLLQDVLNIVNGKNAPTDQKDEDVYELDSYTVKWDVYDIYLNEDGGLYSEYDYIKSLETGNPVTLLTEECDACDWKHPSEIFKN